MGQNIHFTTVPLARCIWESCTRQMTAFSKLDVFVAILAAVHRHACCCLQADSTQRCFTIETRQFSVMCLKTSQCCQLNSTPNLDLDMEIPLVYQKSYTQSPGHNNSSEFYSSLQFSSNSWPALLAHTQVRTHQSKRANMACNSIWTIDQDYWLTPGSEFVRAQEQTWHGPPSQQLCAR